jgi:hypothetical protein
LLQGFVISRQKAARLAVFRGMKNCREGDAFRFLKSKKKRENSQSNFPVKNCAEIFRE